MTLAQLFIASGPSGSQEEPFKIKFPPRDFLRLGVKHSVETAQVLPPYCSLATLFPVSVTTLDGHAQV